MDPPATAWQASLYCHQSDVDSGSQIFPFPHVLFGPFFLCGLGTEDYTSIPDELALKYARKFWMPERFLMLPEGLTVIREDDGTGPDEELLRSVK